MGTDLAEGFIGSRRDEPRSNPQNLSLLFVTFKMILLQNYVRRVMNKLLRIRIGSASSSLLANRCGLRRWPTRCCTRRNLFCDVGIAKDGEMDVFEECWKLSDKVVSSDRDSAILQGLNSPAPQSFYILQRAMKELSKAEVTSFEESVKECGYLIKPGWQLVVENPIQSNGSNSFQWELLPLGSATQSFTTADDAIIVTEGSGGPNAVQLSAQALRMVSKASDSQRPVDVDALEELVEGMERRLMMTLGTDIRGRTSADMAFNLCLSGIDCEFLYSALVKVARLEMERVGQRPSRRARDVLHVAEKLAASGIKGSEVQEVYRLAANSLQAKDEYPQVVKQLLSPGAVDLLSPRPLLWLWRYSSRLQKPAVTKESVPRNLPPWKRFDDPDRPLVVDVGCGLGVSLLGLASQESSSSDGPSSRIPLDWSNCNYLGGDLSEATVRFANTLSKRWDLSDKLQYSQMSAENLLEDVAQYPGPVSLIMVQFPSPWRLKKEGRGNLQLPSGPDDENFMVSEALMKKIADILQAKSRERINGRCQEQHGDRYLLLQTNCEDVALVLRDRAKEFGLTSVPSMKPVTSPDEKGRRVPERTSEWLRLSGEDDGEKERAVGAEWSRSPLLPPRCATETEVACTIRSSPVHRCLFKAETNK